MQYVWQHRLFPAAHFTAVSGESVEVVDPGLLNTGSGPDFFNAKVKIGDRMWAGNVELHVRASDWKRHGHSTDAAYDSVILHVVAVDDARVSRPDGAEIPQIVMACNPHLREHFDELTLRRGDGPACATYLPDIPAINITDWLTALAFERLYRKSDHAAALADRFDGNWVAAAYVMLARALGFGTNAEPFERLALSVPLKVLLKHSDSTVSVEAMLFGQSGFLASAPATDSYVCRLKEEYSFMCSKFDLKAPASLGWKTGRIRPQNQPHRRIALLAAMISGGFRAGYRMMEVSGVAEARALFCTPPSAYWTHRYSFGAEDSRVPRVLSDASVASLVINVVAPLLMAYGTRYARSEMCEKAVGILESLPPENNSVVRAFTDCAVPCSDAFASQALIELRRSYCEPRKCLYCRIGHRILARKAIRVKGE